MSPAPPKRRRSKRRPARPWSEPTRNRTKSPPATCSNPARHHKKPQPKTKPRRNPERTAVFALAPVFQRLIGEGTLEVTDASGKRHRYGDGTGVPVRIRFNDSATPWRILFRPSMALGEGYMNGRID